MDPSASVSTPFWQQLHVDNCDPNKPKNGEEEIETDLEKRRNGVCDQSDVAFIDRMAMRTIMKRF